jgi:iron only hydrogenase large subunit-like protein
MKQQFYHAHLINSERCSECMNCVRICPTQAIRVHKKQVEVLNELCIDCGECINICPKHVYEPLYDGTDDFCTFKYRVVIPSPVLYAQFGISIHPSWIHQALLKIGFDEVVDIGEETEKFGIVLLHHIEKNPLTLPLVSSFCPAVVRLIQVRYPNLIRHIIPLEVPREMLAHKIKKACSARLNLKAGEIGVFYITPCPAKIVSIKQPAEMTSSWLDGAVPIRDIYNMITPKLIEISRANQDQRQKQFIYGKGWSVMGHFSQDVGSQTCLTVAGIGHVRRIFDDIESGRLKNIGVIEALACDQGCVGGSFCAENPYIARHNSFQLQTEYSCKGELDTAELIAAYERGEYFLEHPVLPRPLHDDDDICTSIKRMRQQERILRQLPHKDCSLCGSPTCLTFAVDCAYGEADVTDCVFFK